MSFTGMARWKGEHMGWALCRPWCCVPFLEEQIRSRELIKMYIEWLGGPRGHSVATGCPVQLADACTVQSLAAKNRCICYVPCSTSTRRVLVSASSLHSAFLFYGSRPACPGGCSSHQTGINRQQGNGAAPGRPHPRRCNNLLYRLCRPWRRQAGAPCLGAMRVDSVGNTQAAGKAGYRGCRCQPPPPPASCLWSLAPAVPLGQGLPGIRCSRPDDRGRAPQRGLHRDRDDGCQGGCCPIDSSTLFGLWFTLWVPNMGEGPACCSLPPVTPTACRIA